MIRNIFLIHKYSELVLTIFAIIIIGPYLWIPQKWNLGKNISSIKQIRDFVDRKPPYIEICRCSELWPYFWWNKKNIPLYRQLLLIKRNSHITRPGFGDNRIFLRCRCVPRASIRPVSRRTPRGSNWSQHGYTEVAIMNFGRFFPKRTAER
jgi:hypothetical protein